MATNILNFHNKKRASRYLQPFQIFSSSNTGLNFTKILDNFQRSWSRLIKLSMVYATETQVMTTRRFCYCFFVVYRVTRRVFSKSVTSKLHILFKKILAGSLKTLKVTRISAMYTNFLHPPVHSGPSKFSRPKICNWSLGNTKVNKNLVND